MSTAAGVAVTTQDRYPTLDEVRDAAESLAARYPGLCRLRTIGSSRAGQPLLMLSIGHRPRHALVVAGSHSNEPVGGATAVELAHRVVADPSLRAITWNFVLCLDPDGTRLAEGRSHDSRTLLGHYRQFFRPGMREQPEWAPSVGLFPPESRALLKVIEELRPVIQCSLHSADVGGTYLQLTRDIPGIVEPFTRSAADLGIPVELGPYDAPHWPSPGPGVYVMPPPGKPERFVANVEDARTSTWCAPHRYGGSTLVVEVPLWASDRVADPAPASKARARLAGVAGILRHRGRLVSALLADARSRRVISDSPLMRGAEASLAVCEPLADEWERSARAEDSVPLTVSMTRASSLASLETSAYRIPLRAAAMVMRGLDTAATGAQPIRSGLEELLHEWCAEYERRFAVRWLPVARQVEHQIRTVQAAVALIGASHRQ